MGTNQNPHWLPKNKTTNPKENVTDHSLRSQRRGSPGPRPGTWPYSVRKEKSLGRENSTSGSKHRWLITVPVHAGGGWALEMQLISGMVSELLAGALAQRFGRAPDALQRQQQHAEPLPCCQGALQRRWHCSYSAVVCKVSFSSLFSVPLSSSSISPSSPLNLSWAHLGLVLDLRNMKRPLPRGNVPRPRPLLTHLSAPSPSRSSCCAGGSQPRQLQYSPEQFWIPGEMLGY